MALIFPPFSLCHLGQRLAGEEYDAFVGPQQADDMLHEHGLAGAALADNRGNLIFIYLQIDPVEHRIFAKPLRHVQEFDEGLFRHSFHVRKEVTT